MFHGAPPLTFYYALSVSAAVEAIDAPAIALIVKRVPLPGEADRGHKGKTGGERYIARWPVNSLA
jgi:hypothetical protein